MLDRITKALRERRFLTSDEDELQRAIAGVFGEEGIPYVREFRLTDRGRLDFAVPADEDDTIIAVEVKVDGSLAALTRQLHRYAQDERVSALVSIVTLSRLHGVPRELNGKPVHLVSLLGGAL